MGDQKPFFKDFENTFHHKLFFVDRTRILFLKSGRSAILDINNDQLYILNLSATFYLKNMENCNSFDELLYFVSTSYDIPKKVVASHIKKILFFLFKASAIRVEDDQKYLR